ncbi:MAG: aspartate--tRNA ligase [Candidatus Gracilibacteria bacterium]|nr:aspartate--tRNA ligase [Candidatus Gracilibacteria bacterium]
MLRTHTCNELNNENVGEKVKLSGWVSNRRDHGGIIFIDLRDRYGITQVVFDPEDDKTSWETANIFRSEYVITVEGIVRNRPEGQSNKNLQTGEIEIIVKNVILLSKSKTPPFELDEHAELSNEEIRYKHRYIDLRRRKALENVKFRSRFLNFTRNWFTDNDFLDVQTPIFTVSSPEGARDFVVPSRLHPGKFYALPQAPQQYKQLLMVGGIDKYFQIAPCFRDEDPRADRHACEFYQIDCEMSFVEQDDIFDVVENYLTDAVKNLSEKTIMNQIFYRMSYEEAMENYGTDKPDLRFDLKFVDLTDIYANSEFAVFKSVVESGGVVKAIKLEGQEISRKQIDELTKTAQNAGAKGLAYIIYDDKEETGKRSPILKFMGESEISEMEARLQPKNGDVIFFSASDFEKAVKVLNVVRLELRDKFNLADKNLLSFCFVTDFPMFEENEITGKIDFGHNPFSMPKGGVEAFQNEDLLSIKSVQYDLACNGFEILSGSIRNHDIESLVMAFEKVGRNKQEVMDKFGAMYEAFQYGVPPHGGFAIGMDRFMMILKDENNIREVYAFPKSGKAQDLMMNAPSYIDHEQLDELHIAIVEEDKD